MLHNFWSAARFFAHSGFSLKLFLFSFHLTDRRRHCPSSMFSLPHRIFPYDKEETWWKYSSEVGVKGCVGYALSPRYRQLSIAVIANETAFVSLTTYRDVLFFYEIYPHSPFPSSTTPHSHSRPFLFAPFYFSLCFPRPLSICQLNYIHLHQPYSRPMSFLYLISNIHRRYGTAFNTFLYHMSQPQIAPNFSIF